MFTHAGQDASAVFQVFHSGAAYEQLASFCIGECSDAAPESKSTAFEADYAKLYAEISSRGLFRSRCVNESDAGLDHSVVLSTARLPYL